MFELKGLKVCFIAGTLGQGGAERQLFYIVKTLVESGAAPRVLCLTQGDFWEDRIRALGVTVTFVGGRRSRLGRLGAVIAAVRADRPDVLQSQHFYTNLYAVGAARALGLSEIGAIRCNATWEVTDLGGLFGRYSLRAPRIVAANSRAAMTNAIALGISGDRLRLLPNVVDTDHFAPGGPAHANGAVRLLAVGRRGKQKRFDRLLSILAAVQRRTKRPTKGILVTTGGEERDALERRAVDLGLGADAVEFREAVADMAPVYRAADIFLLTSDWEGTPNVVLEAMASGTPVVATRVGGVPEIVRDGDTGYLAEPADETTFADAVLALVEDGAARLAMGHRARQYVDGTHALGRLPTVLQHFYASVSS